MFVVLGLPKSILVIAVLVIGFLTHFHWSDLSGWSSAEAYKTWTNKRPRANGVILILPPPKRVQQATLTLRNIEDRFNCRLKYPYLLVMVKGEYEEVTDVQKERIAHITEGRAKFTEIPKSQWDAPAFLDQLLMDASIEKIGFSHNYRAMCRWFSGFFWNHPELKQYDWFWRLDTDIEFHCDVPYDPIQRVIDNNALYGFVQLFPDGEWVQPTLASNVSAFMATEKDNFPLDANHGFVWRGGESVTKALRGEAGNREWTGLCTYVKQFRNLSPYIWENPIYTRFFEFLDRAGGFFYERWGDCPVHSFGLAMTLRKDQAVQFKDMGYQHQGWEFTCPVESSSCTCVQEEKFKSFKDRGEEWFNA